MTLKLIINADDYGLTGRVSEGIRDAFTRGIVTSTSAMMNIPAVEPALAELLEHTPELGVGVHLNLTAGKPLLPAHSVSSLVRDDGWFLKQGELKERLDSINLEQVAAEWKAQVALFQKSTGHLPDHLDSHHHSSYFTPGLFTEMVNLAQELGCPIRFPGDVVESSAYIEILAASQVLHPDLFIDSFYDSPDASAGLEAAFEMVSSHSEVRTAEMMCHPGYVDEDLLEISSYTTQREAELRALSSEGAKRMVNERGIELIHFGMLKTSQRSS